jgi:hypothetical protein
MHRLNKKNILHNFFSPRYEYGTDSRATALRLADDVANGRASFIHHFGDISYAVGFLQTWDEFGWMASQYAAATVYAIGMGNHESDWPDSASWRYATPS